MTRFPRLPAALAVGLALAAAPAARAQTAADHFKKGMEYYHADQDRPAIDQFTKALAKDPTHALAYVRRGACYRALGEHAKAFQDFAAAIKADPKCDLAYNHRALLYEKLKQWDRALDDLNKAVAAAPGNPTNWNNRGEFFRDTCTPPRLQEAERDFTKAIQLAPKANYYTARARCREALGNLTGALADADAARKLDPNYFPAWADRVFILYRLGRLAESQREKEALAASGPLGRQWADQAVQATQAHAVRAASAGGWGPTGGCPRCGFGVTRELCNGCIADFRRYAERP